jgi:hypothetical protein
MPIFVRTMVRLLLETRGNNVVASKGLKSGISRSRQTKARSPMVKENPRREINTIQTGRITQIRVVFVAEQWSTGLALAQPYHTWSKCIRSGRSVRIWRLTFTLSRCL